MKQSSQIDSYISPEDWEEFERGVSYFNNGQFQHSYEAWELLWERKNTNDKKFLRGLMELASACQYLTKNQNISSVETNLEKAKAKLEKFLPEHFSIPVEPLLKFIEDYKRNKVSSNHNGERKSGITIPQIEFHKQDNPDLLVELCEILQSPQFLEGVKLFNGGFFWEAHEEWQEVWREQIGEGKIFVEAFVQMAEAYSFIKLGKVNPAIYLFEKSIKRFAEYERIRCSVLLCSLVADIKNTLVNLRESSGNGKIHIKPAKIQITGNVGKDN
jgi:predicted metal-dependent hydrolase